MSAVLDAARREYALGHVPIPIPRGRKGPTFDEWQKFRPGADDLARLFGSDPNMGVLLGEPSHNLIDVDLDWPAARVAGGVLLPQTASVFGRPGAPRSHWRYYAEPLTATLKFTDPSLPGDEAMVVELRSTGAQTVHPPSVHPSGETYAWASDGIPTTYHGEALRYAVRKVAAAAILAKHWPRGGRHGAALALSGVLLRQHWHADDVREFVEAVARAGGDEEIADRVRAVEYTEKRLEDTATGFPTLVELVGDERVTARFKEWLGLEDERWPLRLGGTLISGSPAAFAQEPTAERRVVERPWPDPMGEAAFTGLAGATVAAMLPHTEADRHALLVNLLVFFGAAVGPGPHLLVGGTVHPARLFASLVGTTGRGKKGESWNIVGRLAAAVDPAFMASQVQEGLSSGEGLISAVRDPQYGLVKGEEVMTDPGVADKRLLVVETEFGRLLAVMKREGSTLSAVLRSAWDHGNLRVMTKTQLRATGAHVCVLGHVTPEELVGGLGELWIANGFANRFLWALTRRSKALYWPEPFDAAIVGDLARRWSGVLAEARKVGRVRWATDALELYAEVYPDLTPDGQGITGSLVARAAPSVLRVAMVYALLDGTGTIGRAHLAAALEVWGYSERTVQYLWGASTGDPVADAILKELLVVGEMDKAAVFGLFSNNLDKWKLNAALETLAERGLAYKRMHQTPGGRPREVWYLGDAE